MFDSAWESLLVALVGEQFNDTNVVGVLLSTRTTKYDVIQLWTVGSRKLNTAAKFVKYLGIHYDTNKIVY